MRIMLTGLPPIAKRHARVLILGSMPSAASLQAQQYYAHPNNLFWHLVAEWFGIARDAPYHHRCRALTTRHIALWDVLHQCQREGSLDSAIRQPQANNFAAFYARHRHIVAVFFNGKTAEQIYRRHVLPAFAQPSTAPSATSRHPSHPQKLIGLPSTSPANAGISRQQKREKWEEVMRVVG